MHHFHPSLTVIAALRTRPWLRFAVLWILTKTMIRECGGQVRVYRRNKFLSPRLTFFRQMRRAHENRSLIKRFQSHSLCLGVVQQARLRVQPSETLLERLWAREKE